MAVSGGATPSRIQACGNPEGGACVGALTPGRPYRTTVFRPNLRYSVPTRGWRNYEDNPGNFLLVPPRNTLAGVNAETSDFIGVDTSIAAARFTDLPTCAIDRVPGVPNTPAAIAQWIKRQPLLRVGGPTASTVGGLRGLRVDVRVKPGAKLPTCTEGAESFTVFVLFLGLPPSSLEHGVVANATMRLYLLRYGSGTLAIEVNDKKAAPGTLRSLDAVVAQFRFATH